MLTRPPRAADARMLTREYKIAGRDIRELLRKPNPKEGPPVASMAREIVRQNALLAGVTEMCDQARRQLVRYGRHLNGCSNTEPVGTDCSCGWRFVVARMAGQ